MTAREVVLRYRKDPRVIVSVPLLILAATSLIYYVIQRAKDLSPEALSSKILLFVLWNINVLLIVGIVFVILRGVVKLVLDKGSVAVALKTADDAKDTKTRTVKLDDLLPPQALLQLLDQPALPKDKVKADRKAPKDAKKEEKK